MFAKKSQVLLIKITRQGPSYTLMHTVHGYDFCGNKRHVSQTDNFNFRLFCILQSLLPSIWNPALCLHHFMRRLVTQHYYFTLEIFNYSELQAR